jgi:dTDP-4-amino-4,6-dideoxygalactose transaminase
LIRILAQADIEARPLWKPMHAQPVFASAASYLDGTSDLLFEQGVSLPNGSSMTTQQLGLVVGVIERFLAQRGVA